MPIQNNFDKVVLFKDGLILSLNKKKREILFNDIDSVDIRSYKISVTFTFLLGLTLTCIILFILIYLDFDMVIFPPVLIVSVVFIKIANYKSYGMKIRLKSGDFFIKRVPLKLKDEIIDKVNDIRGEIFKAKMRL